MKKLFVVILMLSLGLVTLGCSGSSTSGPAPKTEKAPSTSGPTEQFPSADPVKGTEGPAAPKK